MGGEMGIAGRIRCGAGVALATTSLLACTPDGIQPAPVYMMGSSTQPSRPAAAIAAPRPTFHPERRQASAAPAPAAMAPIEHSQRPRPSIEAANNPSATPNAHSPIGTRQTAALKKRSRTYPVAGSGAGPIARTEMIPLDDIAAPAPPAARVMPPAVATPSDPTTSTWVSPKPADPPQVEFRPPSPSGS
jgi:hypothetical protein